MSDPRTWEDELRARGQAIKPGPSYGCPGCEIFMQAFAIVQGDDGEWGCANCHAPEVVEQLHQADWNDVRAERDRILADTDWTETPGAQRAMTEAQLARWDAFRSRLRDVPQVAETPADAMALLGDMRTEAQGLRVNNPKE